MSRQELKLALTTHTFTDNVLTEDVKGVAVPAQAEMKTLAEPITRATMRDVAARAGVSMKTVSRVINEQPNVTDELRDRVWKAVQEMDYLPDIHAGNLRRQDRPPQTLGVIVENIGVTFWAEILRAIEDEAAKHNVTTLASSHDGKAVREARLITNHLHQRVDGLIIATISNENHRLVAEQRYGTPIVFLDREPVGIEADTVMSDNNTMTTLLTNHLMQQGHTRIAYLGDRPNLQTSRERLAAFTTAMKARCCTIASEHIFEGVRSSTEGYQATTQLLASINPPTAILSTKDQISDGMLHALHENGMHHQLAHAGIGDLQMADIIDPGFTVVTQDPKGIGRLAAKRIFTRLAGDASTVTTSYAPYRFIQRGSGEIPCHE